MKPDPAVHYQAASAPRDALQCAPDALAQSQCARGFPSAARETALCGALAALLCTRAPYRATHAKKLPPDVDAVVTDRVAARVEAAARRRAELAAFQTDHQERRRHGTAARHAAKLSRLDAASTTNQEINS